MKKIFYIAVALLIIVFSLSACTNPPSKKTPIGEINAPSNETNPPSSETNKPNGTIPSNPDKGETTVNSEILVVYFSCTGTTKTIADYIMEITGGKSYRIQPKVPYTEADLKYYTNCRADKEQADSTARPEIDGTVADMAKYKTVFIGYPIWHGQAPKIIYTFLESYDFSGKTIIPFCTSQSSGIGSSDTLLHSLAPTAEWKQGRRFASGTSKDVIGTWIDGLNL